MKILDNVTDEGVRGLRESECDFLVVPDGFMLPDEDLETGFRFLFELSPAQKRKIANDIMTLWPEARQ